MIQMSMLYTIRDKNTQRNNSCNMKKIFLGLIALYLILPMALFSQEDTAEVQNSGRTSDWELSRLADSIKKQQIIQQFNFLKEQERLNNEIQSKEKLAAELREIEIRDSLYMAGKIERITALKSTAVGYPVMLNTDTLFFIYTKLGSSIPAERAQNISRKINMLYEDDLMHIDSLTIEEADNMVDIYYGELIVMSITELDALWHNSSQMQLAQEYVSIIKSTISRQRDDNNIFKILMRAGLVILVIAIFLLLIWFINKLQDRGELFINSKKNIWLKDLSYKDYTFITSDQELALISFVLKLVKWFAVLVLLYLVLPIVFSIFPFTRGWATDLFSLVWLPFKRVLVAVWEYLPNLFSIIVIYFVMKYFIRFVRYFFSEIESEKLTISGFHADWAMPTFNIVKFLLYAFMFVLIFPYLPGSDSNIFKGVSVFVGVLFSLGSSSAIANMVAGLVITYMRPFKIGDRIKIGDMTGDVIEKNTLVTRLRTPKNEEITIPNSAVLSGNTINYSTYTKADGLIIHSTVTIGYDVPWKDMHETLIEAAANTPHVLADPAPFVLQTSLDDFYVSYQINAYTREASKQAGIYSELHKNIQDACNKRGIEIMSPHYGAFRDGNMTTIPANYLSTDYDAPAFRVRNIKPEDKTP